MIKQHVSGSVAKLAPVGAVHHLLQPPPHCAQLLRQFLHLLSQTSQQEEEKKVLLYSRNEFNSGAILKPCTFCFKADICSNYFEDIRIIGAESFLLSENTEKFGRIFASS